MTLILKLDLHMVKMYLHRTLPVCSIVYVRLFMETISSEINVKMCM